MNLHEYQAKQLLAGFGAQVQGGGGDASRSGEEAKERATAIGGDSWMVKAQVHAGGRGKVGGIKMAKTKEEVEEITKSLIGTRLVTKQTTAAGQPVNSVLVTETVDIERELYLSMLVDRGRGRIAIIASAAGGMNIEEVAATEPDKIVTVFINPSAGLQGYEVRRVGFVLGLDAEQRKQLGKMLQGFYKLFIDKDLSLIEINPLVVTPSGDLICLDAKITADDNGLFRHSEIATMNDTTQEDERETRAKSWDLSYIALDGNIACMVNGAGLAMATMDIIKLFGGEPANFLDVGGTATPERVTEAFKIILSDDKVKAILVNIFGGIVRCDVIAEGIITAVKDVHVGVPIVVRLEGTNVEKGRELLDNSGLNLTSASGFADAAKKVVAAVA
uniref:Succinate--CoA ligase [ADP-forming] subunit beta n=1 Tax=Candidatus Kentrum sp. TC TaxID=2126339 RepID=A0A450Y6Y7_9GAMM|nr:MAG: succinyl-CoA synthetase beta subunit [Candidatus Kentron sp. TC]VFK37831.1 MAG: succinyl-CoA synthetase beta subunit [Candidatus Kentron sp. TC]VFK51369.1 MAG: succinyl-CoA synthetase beta subunit [Candidatus Kentron sp. TC]